MPAKTKDNYSKNSDGAAVRDSFQTPRYATELLIPYIPEKVNSIWECAAGQRRISNVLYETKKYAVISSDIEDPFQTNFLKSSFPVGFNVYRGAIITNPPFSKKKAFYERCIELGVPFALLIPADISLWTIDAVRKYNCEKIIPTRRIDYLTPHICDLVWRGQVNETYGTKYKKIEDMSEDFIKEALKWVHKFNVVDEIPENLIRKYSSSDFHSMWLTWGFGLGKSETFVELSNEMKNRIL